ncbi:hypothetical protein J7413_06870 [Shimia sp. R10_1]|uniref:hypothetical protein n=1 Tax=Shimia sp. R10_1 TaxID=2821095 RepID=UPI001ADC2AF2|nr:hypothetical protein [Shimia sp. R10_1]MBO9473259.1 hypothetical protein [Shimia sp. R10_1]
MNLKIAIIGTSHVAPLYTAWNSASHLHKNIDMVFFAAPGSLFRRFQIDEKRKFGILDSSLFSPQDIHTIKNTFGAIKIDLKQFDTVVHVGQLSRETQLAKLVNQFSIDEFRSKKGCRRISFEAFLALRYSLARSAMLTESWRNWTTSQLYTVPAPRFAESCITSKSSYYAPWVKLSAENPASFMKDLLDDYYNLIEINHKENGINSILPPDEVYAQNGLVRAIFQNGARQLRENAEYSSEDHHHMNIQYGEIILHRILDTIQRN